MSMSIVYEFQRICVTIKLEMIHSYLMYSGFRHNRQKQREYTGQRANISCRTIANLLRASIQSNRDHLFSLAIHSSLALVNLWLVFSTLTYSPEMLYVCPASSGKLQDSGCVTCYISVTEILDECYQNWEKGFNLMFRY